MVLADSMDEQLERLVAVISAPPGRGRPEMVDEENIDTRMHSLNRHLFEGGRRFNFLGGENHDVAMILETRSDKTHVAHTVNAQRPRWTA